MTSSNWRYLCTVQYKFHEITYFKLIRHHRHFGHPSNSAVNLKGFANFPTFTKAMSKCIFVILIRMPSSSVSMPSSPSSGASTITSLRAPGFRLTAAHVHFSSRAPWKQFVSLLSIWTTAIISCIYTLWLSTFIRLHNQFKAISHACISSPYHEWIRKIEQRFQTTMDFCNLLVSLLPFLLVRALEASLFSHPISDTVF